MDLGPDMLVSCPVGNVLLVSYVIHDPTHREVVGRIPSEGGP